MTYKINIKRANIVDQIENYWTKEDYVHLLEKFGFGDASTADEESLNELLLMAITDFDPKEAAEIVLQYKLANDLNEGQIQQLSNEMLIDKVCEEYPVIGLHFTLFQINQLLYKAYNGKFPNAKAIIIELTITPADGEVLTQLSKERVLKLLNNGLSDRNIIKRLFDEQMNQSAPFPEAEDILWDLSTADNSNYVLYTSENWINKEDIIASEFESVLEEVEKEA